jgi:hypothetical protein
MSLARKAAILICAAYPLLAAPQLTTIQDTIYKADGTKFNGTAVISWLPFDAGDSSVIGLQSLTAPILNGAIRVQLVPNTTATPVNYYTVQYSSDGRAQFTENWAVPPSTTSLRIKDVRVTASSSSSSSSGSGAAGSGVVSPPSQSPVTEANVIGLLTDLSLRPIKGAAYGGGRAAMIDASGDVDGVNGNLSDCVRVDGTSTTCFDPTLVPTYSDNETPGGVVDGSNATFTLAATPSPTASLLLYRNGLLLQAGYDYNIQSDGSILFGTPAIPQQGDVLVASYRTSGGTPSVTTVTPQTTGTGFTAVAAQVICSSSGSVTTSATSVSLGSCTIPANVLGAGDRVEIRFTLAHTGVSSGFVFTVLWGGTTLAQRSGAQVETVIAGHGDAAIGPSGTALDIQTWGSQLALNAGVITSIDPLNAPIKVDFHAQLSTAGSDNVELQNYTVLRYPAH